MARFEKFAQLIVKECIGVAVDNGCGDFVDIDYLESRSGYGNANWLYLDPVTIKQVEFPAKGFVIGLNDSAE
jgi:hypothetical protein